LEVIPLGLPEALLSVLLEDDYELDGVKGTEITRLMGVLLEDVLCGIDEYLNDEVRRRLASVLGLTPVQGVDLLAEREHVETTDAALRNDLLQKRQGSPAWQFVRRARQEGSAVNLPTDDEIVHRVLQRSFKTTSGRIVGPAFYLEARRQQGRLLADEVMKAVAYGLVAEALSLVAVADSQFLIEAPEEEATPELLERVAHLAASVGGRLLGKFRPPCRCTQTFAW